MTSRVTKHFLTHIGSEVTHILIVSIQSVHTLTTSIFTTLVKKRHFVIYYEII